MLYLINLSILDNGRLLLLIMRLYGDIKAPEKQNHMNNGRIERAVSSGS